MKKKNSNLKKKIWNFFEQPSTKLAYSVRYFIIGLILYSSIIAFIQLTEIIDLNQYNKFIIQSELFILGVFTIEFFLRFFSSPSKKAFILDKYTWIDALAVFPFYLGIDDFVLLRILRLLRIVRLMRNTHLLKFFQVKNTIISRVTPVVLTFTFIKAIIYILEVKGLWFDLGDLDTLFTILGFALGIVISNKMGTTYSKFIDLRKKLALLHGKLINLSANINIMCEEKGLGKQGIRIVHAWLKDFLDIMNGGDIGGVRKIRVMNRDMYNKAAKIGNTSLIPFHRYAAMMAGLYEESVTLVSRRTLYTPPQYDKLMLQLIVMYLLMLCLFIPELKGIISVFFATYLLYGLHLITIEFDHANGSTRPQSLNLIKIRCDRLQRYLKDLENEIAEVDKK